MATKHLSRVEFVFFDIGGVLINDFSGTNAKAELLAELGGTAQTRPKMAAIWDVWAPWACLNADADDLMPILVATGFRPPTENYSLLEHGHVRRFSQNQMLWPLLDRLKSERCGIISNMYPRMLATIKAHQLMPPAVTSWRHVIDSSVAGLQKPDEDIYRRASAHVSADPADILFVDNLPENLRAPQRLGWQTFWYDPTNHQASVKGLATRLQGQPVMLQ